MEQTTKTNFLLGEEKVSKALMKLGIPTMIGMLISALYSAVDAYFVGGLGTSQMGAVSVVFPVVQLVIGLGMRSTLWLTRQPQRLYFPDY